MRTHVLTDQKFHHLTARWLEREPGKRSLWNCLCECGNERSVLANKLVSGAVKSCGCKNYKDGNEANRKHSNPTTASENALYKRMRHSAKHRKIQWNLTFDQFKGLICLPCVYCGIKPSCSFNAYTNVTTEWAQAAYILYNGIDRIDSNGHYDADNCITSCKQCNYAKGQYTPQEFLEWAIRLCQFNMVKL